MNFDQAFETLIGHEGGYVNTPQDPGKETKYGISKRAYPGEDIPALTLERARAIYLPDYWLKAGCDAVPPALAFDLFDMAVNSGAHQATLILQRAAFVTADGVIGPNTRMALASMDPVKLLLRFNALRLAFLADLPTWPSFGCGWARRIAQNLLEV